MLVDFSGCGQLLAEKTQDVRTAKRRHRVMNEQRVKPCQIVRLAKRNICGPFALVNGPVIVQRKLTKDLFVKRVEPTSDPIQQLRPVGLQLGVHQPLPLLPIGDPREAIVLLLILHSCLIHLPRQPFPPVHANLNRKGKPRSNARIHPSENRVIPILIHVQTFARALHQVQLLGLPIAINVESPARFHACQGAHWSLGDLVLLRYRTRDFLLIVLARWKVLHRTTRFEHAA